MELFTPCIVLLAISNPVYILHAIFLMPFISS